MFANKIVSILLEDESEDDMAESLAMTFMEDEIGRFDWKNNWENYKIRNNAEQKIMDWLQYLGVVMEPLKIIEALDRMARDWNGSWK